MGASGGAHGFGYTVMSVCDGWAQLPVSGAPPPVGAKNFIICCLFEFHHDLNRGAAGKCQAKKNEKALDKRQESL